MQNTMNSGSGSMSDKEAKAAGFKSGAEMTAFYANRARMGRRGGTGTQGKTLPQTPTKKKPAGRSLLDALGGEK